MAPGGLVLLEPPLAILPADALEYKKLGRAGSPSSTFDETSGMARFQFYLPIEGKKDECFEVSLRVTLGDFPGSTPEKTWSTVAPKK
jgi:hypothetical protein